jgi:hypothetical protein
MKRDGSLPAKSDFDRWGGDLDAQCAWKNFGGLTLEQAKARFRGCPSTYQEDFMFMGGNAFAYYFPVIEDYLREVTDSETDDDHEAWILAHCIQNQFERDDLRQVRRLSARVLDLAEYVHTNIHLFGADDKQRRRVAQAWTELVQQVGTSCGL